MVGEDGKNGTDGKDGLSPFIGENGNWWIGENDTGVKANTGTSVPAASGAVSESGGQHTLAVAAVAVSCVSLIGNIVLIAAFLLSRKKRLM